MITESGADGKDIAYIATGCCLVPAVVVTGCIVAILWAFAEFIL